VHYLLIPSIIDRFLSFAQLIPCYPHIQNDPKFYPYFEHAVGAIDGSHMGCCPSAEDQDAAHDWRGLFTQNALAAYTIENFAFSMSLVDMKDLLQMLICMNQYMYLTSVCQLASIILLMLALVVAMHFLFHTMEPYTIRKNGDVPMFSNSYFEFVIIQFLTVEQL